MAILKIAQNKIKYFYLKRTELWNWWIENWNSFLYWWKELQKRKMNNTLLTKDWVAIILISIMSRLIASQKHLNDNCGVKKPYYKLSQRKERERKKNRTNEQKYLPFYVFFLFSSSFLSGLICSVNRFLIRI